MFQDIAEMAFLFNHLESSDPLTVEEAKKELTKTFSQSMCLINFIIMMLRTHSSQTIKFMKISLFTPMAHFSRSAKDSWVVSGMMDYYSNTNSVRIVDVLVKVQAPHDNYIFDKLFEWVNSAKRNQAFNLFWHIVKKHPSWLHKVATHPLFKEMLKVLKVCSILIL